MVMGIKMGMPVPPTGGMPAMMPQSPVPMAPQPMGAGPMVPPSMPVPPMQPPMPMGQGAAPVPPQNVSNAPRRRRFGDALEGMMSAGRPRVGADQMRNMNMFTGQMMSPRPPMAQQPVRRMAEGGAVPRQTTIAGQPHYLAYINPEEGALLKGLGGAEAPGPGGIPSYFLSDLFSGIRDAFSGGGGPSSSSVSNDSGSSNVGSSGYASLDAIANQAVKEDPKQSFSYMGKSYDNVNDYHDAIFGDDDDGGSSNVTPMPTTPVDFTLPPTVSTPQPPTIATIDYSDPGMPVTFPELTPQQDYVELQNKVVNQAREAVQQQLSDRGISAAPEDVDYLTTQRMLGLEEPAPESVVEKISGIEGVTKPITESAVLFTPEQDIFNISLDAPSVPSMNVATMTPGTPELGFLPPTDPTSMTDDDMGLPSGPVQFGRNLSADMDPSDRQRVTAQNLVTPVSPENLGDDVEDKIYESGIGGDRTFVGPDAVKYGTGAGGSVTLANAENDRRNLVYDRDNLRYTLDGTVLPSLGDSDAAAIDASIQAGAARDFTNPLLQNVLDDYGDADDLVGGSPAMIEDTDVTVGTPSAFPSGRLDIDVFQPPHSADVGATKEALMDAVKQRVSEVEGTSGAGGYNMLLGGSQDRFLDKPLTEMTVQEVLDMQSQRGAGTYAGYSQEVNKNRGATRADGSGTISTPAGKYQVVGSTMRELIRRGVIDPNEKYDADTQERIGSFLIENRGLFDTEGTTRDEFIDRLGNEFEGIERFGYDSEGDGGVSVATQDSINQAVKDVIEPPKEGILAALEQSPLMGGLFGIGKQILTGAGEDLKMGMTAGLFGSRLDKIKNLEAAGYTTEEIEDYFRRTDENIARQREEALRQSQDDDSPVNPCQPGYVLDPSTGVCVPEGSVGDGGGGADAGPSYDLNRTRDSEFDELDDIMKRIVKPVGDPVPMKQGGMVGLNRVADNFLAAMGR